jgi:hypothetical protein
MRGQTELPALAIAFLLLTGTVVLGVAVADSALTSAERPALEAHTAMSLSERLVSKDAPLTVRANVLDNESVAAFNETTLVERYNVPPDTAVEVRVDGELTASTGTVTVGTTVERIVLVERRSRETIRSDFDSSRNVVLPRRTSNVTLTITPPRGTTVERVVANGRTLLRNESGLTGTFEVGVSPYETTQLTFDAVGVLDGDSVRIEYEPPETEKAILQVTVDAEG